VPSYNLKKLHNLIKDQLPKPFPSLFSFYRQVLPIVIKQARDPSIYFKVNFPEKKI
jgi:fatty acid desaturase